MFNLTSIFHNDTPPSRYETDNASHDFYEATDSGIDDYQQSPFEIINSSRQIIHTLHQAICARQPVLLSSPHLGNGMPSRLLGINQPGNEFFIRQLIDDKAHASLQRGGRFNVLLRQKEATILLSLPHLRSCRFDGHDGYAAPLPTWAVSSQMRSWRRIHLHPSMFVTLRHTFPDKDFIEARLTDISEGGVGIALPHHPLRGIKIGERWCNASLTLKNMEVGRLAMEVQNARSEVGNQRIGLAICDASEGQMQRLRRLLLRLQSPAH